MSIDTHQEQQIKAPRPLESRLPTEELISQGKEDLNAVISAFPQGLLVDLHTTLSKQDADLVDRLGFREILLSPDFSPIWGCFLGFTGHASQLSGLLSMRDAQAMKEYVEQTTESRMLVVSKPVREDPDIANIHLFNLAKLRQIVKVYPSVFPKEAMSSPEEWIHQLLESKGAEKDLFFGLISGFPPKSVLKYAKGDRSGKGVTIPGIGGFTDFGKDDAYLKALQSLYRSSGIDALIAQLRKNM